MLFFRMIARLFGYLIVKKKKYPLDVHMYVANLLDQLGVNCVIDVGANVGQYGRALRKNGFKGHIFSFEPVRENYDALEKCAGKDPHWHIFNFALGSQDSTTAINVTRRSEFSSFLRPNKYSQDVFQDQVSISTSEDVKMTTLDVMIPEIVRDLPAPRIYLKMDTQGYDLEVLKGAVNSINNILALQSELSVLPLYVGMPDYLQALGIFKSYGFEPAGFYPIARDTRNQALIEIDCVMVRVGKTGTAS
jgi:FkbM family methyltransferase